MVLKCVMPKEGMGMRRDLTERCRKVFDMQIIYDWQIQPRPIIKYSGVCPRRIEPSRLSNILIAKHC